MRLFESVIDFVRGKAVTIPPMDGALRPNTLLEDADVLVTCDTPDSLSVSGGRLLIASHDRLLAYAGDGSGQADETDRFGAPITCLAADAAGTIIVGLETGHIHVRRPGRSDAAIDGFNCPVAVALAGDDAYVCNGSTDVTPANWARDLMQKAASGSVWRVSLSSGERTRLATGLGFPFGVAVDRSRRVLAVSEAWRHRLIGVPLDGGDPTTLLDKLPGYPGRIMPMEEGGYVLSLFAPRNRLIEFVLLEDRYRADMMREVDSTYWIAPSLSASQSFLEPLQNGGVKTMGIHKPWSPTRSYGLVVTLNSEFQPVASYHSRANGRRHGITCAVLFNGRVVAASKGGSAVLSVRQVEEAS